MAAPLLAVDVEFPPAAVRVGVDDPVEPPLEDELPAARMKATPRITARKACLAFIASTSNGVRRKITESNLCEAIIPRDHSILVNAGEICVEIWPALTGVSVASL